MRGIRTIALDIAPDDEPGSPIMFFSNGRAETNAGDITIPVKISGYPAYARLGTQPDTAIDPVSGEPTLVWQLYREEARFNAQYSSSGMNCLIKFAPVKVPLIEKPFPSSVISLPSDLSEDTLVEILTRDFQNEFSPDLVTGQAQQQREFAAILNIAVLYTRQQFSPFNHEDINSIGTDEPQYAFDLVSFDTRFTTHSYWNMRTLELNTGRRQPLTHAAQLFSLILKVFNPRLMLTYAYLTEKGTLASEISFVSPASFLQPYEAQSFHDRVYWANLLRTFLLENNEVTEMNAESVEAFLSGIDEEVAPVLSGL